MKRIVIVDDALELGRMLRSALLTLDPNLPVSVLPSAEEALLEATRYQVSVLVTDIRLPGMTGLELVKKFRNRQKDVRVVLITGLSDDRIAEQANALGVDAFLQKPLDMTEFLQVVGSLLGLGQAEPAPLPVLVEPEAPLATEKTSVEAPMPPAGQVVEEEPSAGLSQLIADLRQRLGALAALLLDERGRPVIQAGEFQEPSFETQWVPVLMPALSTNLKLARLADPEQARNVLTLRGAAFDLALAAIGQFALVVVLKSSRSALRLALALEEMLEVQKELIAALDQMGILVQISEPVLGPAEALQPAAEAAQPAEVAEEVLSPESGADLEKLASLLGTANELGVQDVNAFWDSLIEEKDVEITNPDVISYDQARRLGFAPGEEN